MAKLEEETTKAYCNKCFGETYHQILHVETSKWSEPIDEEVYFYGGDTFEMLKCRGCETITLRHKSWFSTDTNDEGQPNITYYPPAVSRREPDWLNDLALYYNMNEDFLEGTLKEIYIALKNDSRRLAAMGVRSLLEQIMIEKVGDQGTFKSNLQKFLDEGYISKLQMKNLETILEAGHAAIHGGFKPSKEELSTVVDIAESVVESIYIHIPKAQDLSSKIPPRNG
ncbi:MAG: DUF4145 domain-containing protein [Pyrinomonadaceae bacterium]